LQKLEEIRNFKNDSRHSTQLKETSKTKYILYTDANDSHDRVVSVPGFALAQAKPWRFITDRGVESVAKALMDYYDKKDIIKKVTYTNDEIKCAMVARANRTFLERFYKYLGLVSIKRLVS
jgi:hypothetical protein